MTWASECDPCASHCDPNSQLCRTLADSRQEPAEVHLPASQFDPAEGMAAQSCMRLNSLRDRNPSRSAARPDRSAGNSSALEGREHASLRDSEKSFRLLVEAVKDYAIFMLDPEGNVVSWNPGAERIKGYTAREIVGRHFSTFYTAEDRARGLPAQVLAIAVAEGRFEDEGWRVRKDGTRFWASVVLTPIRDKNGHLRGFGKITRDLTARKQMDALRERQGQLKEFLAMLCHELRNPLAPIVNALALIRNASSEEQSALLDVIERQTSQVIRLVDDLVDVNRVTRGKVTLKREVADLGNLVSQAMETCRPLIDERRHTVELCLSSKPLPVHVDATRIIQAAVNLLTNAAKYTPRGGRISVSTDSDNDRAVLRVRDSGVGIPAPLLPKIFDLFVQGERPLDRPEGGLGIGLTLVRQIIELHGGSVSAFSEGANRGSEFIACLPLAVADSLAAASKPEAEPEPTLARTRRRLLLVEDNRDSAATLASLLEIAGHEVRVIHDGRHALPISLDYRPQAVVMDIGVPGLNGYEVARQFRASLELARIPLIALTGYGDDSARQEARDAGFDHYLVKPVEPSSLMTIIDQLGIRN